MILKDIVSLLANRINQPRVIEGYLRKVYAKGYEAGTKQSPWISVKEQLPETNDGQSLYEVVVVTSDRRFLVVINTEVEHLVGLLGVTHWMPIPSFDEILEANRDVLERIKEKGD
ncbi:DUF551 domain-containing protein [Bacteroides ovatus]|uniref:DUF551 domain-containing protein n=1 Tax=Bacteroides ovatus TaxID=28116 RepID=UPI00321A0AF2